MKRFFLLGLMSSILISCSGISGMKNSNPSGVRSVASAQSEIQDIVSADELIPAKIGDKVGYEYQEAYYKSSPIIGGQGGKYIKYELTSKLEDVWPDKVKTCAEKGCYFINNNIAYYAEGKIAVKRHSDGQEFKVGDKVMLGEYAATIVGIALAPTAWEKSRGFLKGSDTINDRLVLLRLVEGSYPLELKYMSVLRK